MSLNNDSIFVQILHQNKAVPIYYNINSFEKTQTRSDEIREGKNVSTENIYKITIKNDNSFYLSEYYKYSNCPELMLNKNLIFNSLKTKREIFISVKDSIKPGNTAIQQKMIFIPNPISFTNLLIISLIVVFSLLAWTKELFSKYYYQLFRSLFTYSEANKLYFDQNALIDRFYSILNILFIFSGGIFLYFIGSTFGIDVPVNSIYLKLLICLYIIFLIYVFRYLTIKFIGWLLYQHSAFNEYLHSSFIYYKATGIFLLPIITISGFIGFEARKNILIIGCIIFLLTYFTSIYRGTQIMLKKGILLFYWILYLCTVEFFPLVLFYKYFRNIL